MGLLWNIQTGIYFMAIEKKPSGISGGPSENSMEKIMMNTVVIDLSP
jgi:hypothetical protein